MINKMVVIPSDPLSAYEKAGYLNRMIEGEYFNPANVARNLIIASPYETGDTTINGVRVVGVPKRDFEAFLNKEKPDLIRAYGSYWASDLAVYSSPDIPVMVSVHDTKRSLFHRSLTHANRIMAVSPIVKDLCIKTGAIESKIEYIPNWVDTLKFQSCFQRFEFPFLPPELHNAKKILHVGRKARQKNIKTLITAVSFLPKDHITIFVGRGNDKPYKRYAQKIGVADRCFWIESVDSKDLPLWYSSCDIFCLPSKWEGFGIVLIEAAACGAAIVTSDIAPMNQLLPRDAAVFVKKYNDGQEIAREIMELISNTGKLAQLKQKAQDASKMYSKEEVQRREAECILKTSTDNTIRSKIDYKLLRFFYKLRWKLS